MGFRASESARHGGEESADLNPPARENGGHPPLDSLAILIRKCGAEDRLSHPWPPWRILSGILPTAQKSNGGCGAPAVRPQGTRRQEASSNPRCIQAWAGGSKAAGIRKKRRGHEAPRGLADGLSARQPAGGRAMGAFPF
jgi:hypothetical protein